MIAWILGEKNSGEKCSQNLVALKREFYLQRVQK